MESLAALPGLSRTTPEFRTKLVQLAHANDLDPDNVAAVISLESGFRANEPNSRGERALGLIQFWRDYFAPIARAAKMNVQWEDLRTLSAEDQLPLVVAFFKLQGLKAASSATDYLVATFLPSQKGKPRSAVLGARGSSALLPGTKLRLGTIYASNPTYDYDGDGRITIGDLEDKIRDLLNAAATQPRLPVDTAPPAADPRPEVTTHVRAQTAVQVALFALLAGASAFAAFHLGR